MPYYRVRSARDIGESYWLLATSENEARRIIALNVEAAREARDARKFECAPSTQKQPPEGLIYRRFHGPLSIEER